MPHATYTREVCLESENKHPQPEALLPPRQQIVSNSTVTSRKNSSISYNNAFSQFIISIRITKVPVPRNKPLFLLAFRDQEAPVVNRHHQLGRTPNHLRLHQLLLTVQSFLRA